MKDFMTSTNMGLLPPIADMINATIPSSSSSHIGLNGTSSISWQSSESLDMYNATTSASTSFNTALLAKFCLALCSVLYASNYMFTKELQTQLPPSIITFVRFFIASICFLPNFLFFRGSKEVILGSIEMGFWCGLGFISQAFSLKHSSSSKVSFFCGLGVIMPPIFASIEHYYESHKHRVYHHIRKKSKQFHSVLISNNRNNKSSNNSNNNNHNNNDSYNSNNSNSNSYNSNSNTNTKNSSSTSITRLVHANIVNHSMNDNNNYNNDNDKSLHHQLHSIQYKHKYSLKYLIQKYILNVFHSILTLFPLPSLLALCGGVVLELGGVEAPAWSDLALLLTPFSFAMCFHCADHHIKKFPKDSTVITGTLLSTTTIMCMFWTLMTKAINYQTISKDVNQLVKLVFSDRRIIFNFLYTGLLCTALTALVEQWAMKSLNASQISLIYTLEPIFATAFGVLYLHEELTRITIIGALFVISACILDALHITLY